MFSRAHLLIEREFENLQVLKPWGIEALPVNEDNMFEWVAKIRGLKDTLWEGGIFRVYLKFDEHFNFQPPQVCFHTVPFHPNIDRITGKPCMDILDDKWQKGYSIPMLLLSIQSLLSSPCVHSAVNKEAVNMLKQSPFIYREMIQECVAASQRVEAGLSPRATIEKKVILTHEEKPVKPRPPLPIQITKLSFDDYYTTWCGIATSKAAQNSTNPLLEIIKDNPMLQEIHRSLPLEEIQAMNKKQMKEHATLLNGRFGTRATEDKAAKLTSIERMRRIYLPPSRPSVTPTVDILFDSTGIPTLTSKDEPWEKDVDDLVAWTANLDATAIDT